MKRDIFNELKEGFTALDLAQQEKITLSTHTDELKDNLVMTRDELSNLTVERLSRVSIESDPIGS